jgi:hypothetical protein
MIRKVSSDRRCINQNDMKKENTHGLPSLGYHGEAITLPSTQSPPLLYGIIKMVSNGHGPSLLVEVIFTAINPLGWCTVGGIVLPSSALPSFLACALVVVPSDDGSQEAIS